MLGRYYKQMGAEVCCQRAENRGRSRESLQAIFAALLRVPRQLQDSRFAPNNASTRDGAPLRSPLLDYSGNLEERSKRPEV
jgi:hypothetical protein